MKKLLVFGLSLAMLLSLTACHKPQAEQPTEPTTTPAATSEPVQEPTVSPEPVKDTTPEKLTSTTPAASTEPENIQPVEDAELQEPVETELFTEVNETVYATGTVNIRASWSVESEKLGALSKGDAVTRTGTAIEGTEADGWSRIKISDGRAEDGTEQFKEVYVSTRYLSTTKPSAQQQATSKPSKPSSTQQQQQTTKPSSGKQQSDDSQSLASLLEGLVDEDGYSIGHRDKDRDWSGYESSNGHKSTDAERVQSWS